MIKRKHSAAAAQTTAPAMTVIKDILHWTVNKTRRHNQQKSDASVSLRRQRVVDTGDFNNSSAWAMRQYLGWSGSRSCEEERARQGGGKGRAGMAPYFSEWSALGGFGMRSAGLRGKRQQKLYHETLPPSSGFRFMTRITSPRNLSILVRNILVKKKNARIWMI